MSAPERGIVFGCAGEELVGVVHPVASPVARGVLVVVGGPQYRVGSHRQFVLLARRLAAAYQPGDELADGRQVPQHQHHQSDRHGEHGQPLPWLQGGQPHDDGQHVRRSLGHGATPQKPLIREGARSARSAGFRRKRVVRGHEARDGAGCGRGGGGPCPADRAARAPCLPVPPYVAGILMRYHNRSARVNR